MIDRQGKLTEIIGGGSEVAVVVKAVAVHDEVHGAGADIAVAAGRPVAATMPCFVLVCTYGKVELRRR